MQKVEVFIHGNTFTKYEPFNKRYFINIHTFKNDILFLNSIDSGVLFASKVQCVVSFRLFLI